MQCLRDRLMNRQTMMLGEEARQTTSNLGRLSKPSIQALIHGLNRHYYSIAINYRHVQAWLTLEPAVGRVWSGCMLAECFNADGVAVHHSASLRFLQHPLGQP